MGVVIIEASTLDAIMNKLESLEQKLDAMVATGPADEIIGPEEAAKLLGMTVGTVYRKCRENEIPHLISGRYYRFEKLKLIEWMRGAKR